MVDGGDTKHSKKLRPGSQQPQTDEPTPTTSSTKAENQGCCGWRRQKTEKPKETQQYCFGKPKNANSADLDEELEEDGVRHLSGWESKSLRQNSFHHYGIALQSPHDYYTFIQRPRLSSRSYSYSKYSNGLPGVSWRDGSRAKTNCSRNGSLLSNGRCVRDSLAKVEGTRSSERKHDADRSAPTKPQTNFTLCSSIASCSNADLTTCDLYNRQGKSKTPLFGIISVRLSRRNGSQLGLGIAGGVDREIPPTISYLRPGFIAHRCDQLQVGERLLAVNGIKVTSLTHHQIMILLRNAGPTVTLEVEYDLNSDCFQRPPPATTLQRCAEIGLEDDFDGLSAQSPRSQLRGGNKVLEDDLRCQNSLYGLTLRGGAYGPDVHKNRPITVTGIRPGGPAHRESRLRVGDRILAINGVDVTNATLSVAQNLLRRGLNTTGSNTCRKGKVVQLTVEYDVSVLATLRKATGPLLLEIEKVPGVDFGLVLAIRKQKNGAVSNSHQKSRSIVVQGIVRASIADRCGAIHVGDQLHSIDGISLELTSMAEVHQLLRSQCPILRLELLPLNQQECGRPSQQAARTVEDDHNTPTSPIRSQQNVPPEAQPKNQPRKLRSQSKHSTCYNRSSVERRSAEKSEKSLPLPSHRKILENGQQLSKSMVVGSGQAWPPERFGPKLFPTSGSLSGHFTPNTIGTSSTNGIPSGQICHSETMEVVLHDDSGGKSQLSGRPGSTTTNFGIALERMSGGMELEEEDFDGYGRLEEVENASQSFCSSPLFISNIEKNSPADRCGVLQVGDRIISINDWFTANGTIEEAAHVLSHCGNAVALLVEFDVIESVLPSTGLFLVKLAKRGNNLGIVCKSETNNEKGEPVVISDIRTGSVAHRCGSIQIGDQIRAIDNISLDSCTVEESMRLLQRSGNVVKLCVLKGNAEDHDSADAQAKNNSVIQYSIELNRKQQPLGITIASAGGKANPVVISQLAPGGLAERTGAMHVGDRIIAINGELLEGKKVAHAIHLLQQATDVVSIKLSRNIGGDSVGGVSTGNLAWRCLSALNNLNNHTLSTIQSDSVSDASDKLETPLKSVDSAVESLEDSSEGVQLKVSSKSAYHQSTNTRPSTSNCYYHGSGKNHPDVISGGSSEQGAWDSGLSSAADTATQPTISGLNECCACSGSTPTTSGKSNPTTTNNSPSDGPNMSRRQEEDWMRILEALETVGEEEMLNKLEESIMSYGKVAATPGFLAQTKTHSVVQSDRYQHPMRKASPPRSLNFPPLSSSNRENNNALLVRKSRQAQPPRQGRVPVNSYHHYSSTSNQPSALLDQATSSIMYKNSLQDHLNDPLSTPILNQRVSSRTSSNSANSINSEYFHVTGEQLGSVIPSRGSYVSMYPPRNYEERSLPPPMPSPKPNFSIPLSPKPQRPLEPLTANKLFVGDQESPIPFITSPIPTKQRDLEDPADVSIFSVSLTKDPLSRSFGFSVSDGDSPESPGIFVNSVITGSPADGLIKPMDRVLQINGTSIQFLDCDLAVPLLATDRVELLLLRKRRSVIQRNKSSTGLLQSSL